MPKRNLFDRPYTPEAAIGFDSEHLLRSENLPFDIDVWYPALKQLVLKP
jgi:hypothetical protein